MKYIRAKANFIRYTDEKLLLQASYILSCMKNSTVFNNPTLPLPTIEEAYQDYQKKVIEAKNGSREKKLYKRESKQKLCKLLQQLVTFVNLVSDGKLSLLYSSGFPVLTEKRKGQVPKTPSAPFLCTGRTSGEVAFGFKPVGRDMFYDYRFATEINSYGLPQWGEISYKTNSFKTYYAGFIPGQYIYFQVRARNKHGQSHWTAPLLFMVG
jgi:hypothetical protein